MENLNKDCISVIMTYIKPFTDNDFNNIEIDILNSKSLIKYEPEEMVIFQILCKSYIRIRRISKDDFMMDNMFNIGLLESERHYMKMETHSLMIEEFIKNIVVFDKIQTKKFIEYVINKYRLFGF